MYHRRKLTRWIMHRHNVAFYSGYEPHSPPSTDNLRVFGNAGFCILFYYAIGSISTAGGWVSGGCEAPREVRFNRCIENMKDVGMSILIICQNTCFRSNTGER